MKKRNEENNSPAIHLASKTVSNKSYATVKKTSAMWSSRALPNTQLSPGKQYQSNLRRTKQAKNKIPISVTSTSTSKDCAPQSGGF